MGRIGKQVKKNMKELSKKSNEENFFKETICENCGKEFKFDKREYYYKKPMFCGDKCEDEYKEKEEAKRIELKIKEIIPKRFQDIDTDRDIKDLVDKSVFLSGDVGTGKSVIAGTLGKKYIREGKKVDWISYPKFIMKLQNLYHKDSNKGCTPGGAIRVIKTPFDLAMKIAGFSGILIVDDIGAEKLTEFVRQITYFIINEREQHDLLTIITSNFSLSKIDEIIDRRISSRIAGMCKCWRLSGKDRRIKKGGEK